jgi:hypothetical protein
VKKKAVAIWLVVILLCTGAGVAIYFAVKPKPIGGPNLELNTKYYLSEIRAGLYYYPNSIGMPSLEPVHTVQYNGTEESTSWCQFENNWKILRMHFANANPAKSFEFVFVITKIKHGGGGIDAVTSHLYNGKVYTYKISATRDSIDFSAAATYTVAVASDDYVPSPKIELFRENTTLISFTRQITEYMI